MASVWYMGRANVRTVMGFRWARENGWSIPESEFTMDQLEALIGDPLFARGKPDGPRQMLAIPGSNVMDETFYLYYTEIMKILDNLDGYGLSFEGKVQTYAQLPANAPNDTLWLVIDDEMVYYRDNNVWPAQGFGIKLAGRDGTDGADGTNGTNGVDGEDGLDGVSVSSVTAVGTMMKIVLSNGAEFSLEMPPGPKGDQGLPGGVLTVAGFGGNVTKEQLGINNVDNTRDIDKEISAPTQQAFDFLSAAFGQSLGQLQTELAEKQDEPQVNAIVSAAISNLVSEDTYRFVGLPTFFHDFEGMTPGSTAPVVTDSGHEVYWDSQPPFFTGNDFASLSPGGATYFCTEDLGAKVTHVGARFKYAPNGGGDGGLCCVAITDRRWSLANIAETNMGVHFWCTPTTWALTVWEAGTGQVPIVYGYFDTRLTADGTTEYMMQCWIAGNKATIILPNGVRRIAIDDRFTSLAGNFAFFESMPNAANDDLACISTVRAGIGKTRAPWPV